MEKMTGAYAMLRTSKTEVAAINIRISDVEKRNYINLIDTIFRNRVPINVRGNTFVSIANFSSKTGEGVFGKYSMIDGKAVSVYGGILEESISEDINEIFIPKELQLNLSEFRFFVDKKNHIIVFESHSSSKYLSPKFVEKYFKESIINEKIYNLFGKIDADIIKSYKNIKNIIDAPNLTRLKIVLRRPNTDTFDDEIENEINERLLGQCASQIEETIISEDKEGLKLSSRTRKYAIKSAKNGELSATNIVNGVQKNHKSNKVPETISGVFKNERDGKKNAFYKLKDQIIKLIVDQDKIGDD